MDYGDRVEITIKNADGVSQTVVVNDGERGEAGNGITSIQKVSTDGLVDTYQITFDNGETSSFTVTNGRNGEGGGGGSGSCIYVLGEDESLESVPEEYPVVIDPDGEADGGGGGVSSWNDLTDKPFGETNSETITYDGVLTEPYVTIAEGDIGNGIIMGQYFVKVSDSVPTVEELTGKEITTVTTFMGEDTVTKTIFPGPYDIIEDGVILHDQAGMFIIPKDGFIFEDEEKAFLFPSKGIYLICITVSYPGLPTVQYGYTKSVTVPGYVFKQIKQIEEKYIPDSIQRVGDDLIINSSTEGSTKKFKISVDDSGTISAVEVTG